METGTIFTTETSSSVIEQRIAMLEGELAPLEEKQAEAQRAVDEAIRSGGDNVKPFKILGTLNAEAAARRDLIARAGEELVAARAREAHAARLEEHDALVKRFNELHATLTGRLAPWQAAREAERAARASAWTILEEMSQIGNAVGFRSAGILALGVFGRPVREITEAERESNLNSLVTTTLNALAGARSKLEAGA